MEKGWGGPAEDGPQWNGPGWEARSFALLFPLPPKIALHGFLSWCAAKGGSGEGRLREEVSDFSQF